MGSLCRRSRSWGNTSSCQARNCSTILLPTNWNSRERNAKRRRPQRWCATRACCSFSATQREEAQALFGGQGSFGNGSAMRVATLRAYFADDLDMVVEQAERSAVTTHCHPEAVA